MRTWCERSLSDDTYVYGFALEKEKTVEDVVEWILKGELGQWGTISINDKHHSFWEHLAKCEYNQGRIKGEPLPKEYLEKEVLEVTSNGGWGTMSYVIFVKGE